MPSAPRLVLLLLLAASVRAQAPAEARGAPVDGIRFAAQPVAATSPSLAKPAQDPKLLLGEHPLAPAPKGVVDGDTIRVTGLEESLRLVGLDAEETFKDKGLKALAARDWQEYLSTVNAGHDPARPPKYGSPMGEAAKDFARAFFEPVGRVRLEYDDPAQKVDYYGRHLVLVLAERDGRLLNFNVEVVRQGLSPYFVKYGRSARCDAAFAAAEKEAREAGRGIWAAKPVVPCYPDYEARLRWWHERARLLEHLAARRARGERIVLLGRDGAWEDLIARAGQAVVVAGTPGSLKRRGDTGLQPLGHKAGTDFLIAGPVAEVQALELEKRGGDLVLVAGRVSLYRGQPQFRVEDLVFNARSRRRFVLPALALFRAVYG